MSTFYVTFGQDHEAVASWIDRRGWLEIEAETEQQAREMIFELLGPKWAFMSSRKPTHPAYTRGALARLTANGLEVLS